MAPGLGIKKVLVADDDPDIRRLAKAMLVRHGCEVVEAADGDEIIAVAFEHKPELMVVDVVLPTMTGYEAVGELAKKGFSCPVLFYSAVAKDAEGELVARIEALVDQMP
jgi:CheY-like chemotaxis protein